MRVSNDVTASGQALPMGVQVVGRLGLSRASDERTHGQYGNDCSDHKGHSQGAFLTPQ